MAIKNKTVVVGIGDIYRQDDGIGPRIIEELQTGEIQSVDYATYGSDVFSLLDIENDYSTIMVIDAVNMGEPPGTVRLFHAQETTWKLHPPLCSTHGFGLAEILELLSSINHKTSIKIIGIQPEQVSYENNMSQTLQKQWPTIIETVKMMINQR